MPPENCDRCGKPLTLADPDGPLLLSPPYRFLCVACWRQYHTEPPLRGINGDPVDLVAP